MIEDFFANALGAGISTFLVNFIFQRLKYKPLKKELEENKNRINLINVFHHKELDKIIELINSVKSSLEKDIEKLNLSDTYLTETQREEFNSMIESQKLKIERLAKVETSVSTLRKRLNDLIVLEKFNSTEVKKIEGMIEEIKTLLEAKID